MTYDTLKPVDKLKAAGFPQDQAEAVARVLADAQDEPVTKYHLGSRNEPIWRF